MITQFDDYINLIKDKKQKEQFTNLLNNVITNHPDLKPRIAWNMPVFTYKDTYIIGFAAFTNHFSVAPEPFTIAKFSDSIRKAGYDHSKGLFKIRWSDIIDYQLIESIILFNIEEKAACKTFWRK